MCNLSKQGFQTWATRFCELARSYHIDINGTVHIRSDHFKSLCSDIIKQEFIDKWNSEISSSRSTILETYALYKSHYVTEAYLDLISNPKHRIAVSKLRAKSHNLKIERGRYTRPITNLEERLCPVCHVVDNEIHFVTRCRINENLRVPLWNKIKITQPDFSKLDDKGKFCYLMSNCDPRTLSWFGKYVYQSFNVRNEKVYGNQWFIDFFPFRKCISSVFSSHHLLLNIWWVVLKYVPIHARVALGVLSGDSLVLNEAPGDVWCSLDGDKFRKANGYLKDWHIFRPFLFLIIVYVDLCYCFQVCK